MVHLNSKHWIVVVISSAQFLQQWNNKWTIWCLGGSTLQDLPEWLCPIRHACASRNFLVYLETIIYFPVDPICFMQAWPASWWGVGNDHLSGGCLVHEWSAAWCYSTQRPKNSPCPKLCANETWYVPQLKLCWGFHDGLHFLPRNVMDMFETDILIKAISNWAIIGPLCLSS